MALQEIAASRLLLTVAPFRQIGKMLLLSAVFGVVDPVLTIAASLGFRSPFTMVLGKERLVDECKRRLSRGSLSDHMTMVYTYDAWRGAGRDQNRFCFDNFINSSTMGMIDSMRAQFADLVMSFSGSKETDVLPPSFVSTCHHRCNV